MNKSTTKKIPWYGNRWKTLLVIAVLFAFSFTTVNAQTVEVGNDETTTSNYVPFYYLYQKGYSQTIYTADELHDAGIKTDGGTITTLRYKPTTSQNTSNWKDWTVYIGTTTKEGFDDGEDWVDNSELTQVFDGEIADEVEADVWLEIDLDQSFDWDGQENIVIAVNQTTAAWGSNPSWAGYELEPENGSKGVYDYRDGANFDPANMGSGTTTNTVAQIQLDGDLMEGCTDADAGIAMADFSICEGVAFTLETENPSSGEAGLSYQWEESTDGSTWSDIDGANSAIYTVADGIDSDMYYRLNVICENGGEDTSDAIAVELNTNVEECYCEPEGTNSSRYIDNFSATGDGDQEIDNQDSGFSDGGYGDFTDMVVSADADSEVNFDADIVGGTAGFRIWVDWNKDGQFDPEEEVAYQSSGYSANHEGSFDVPGDADGDYRMRIVSHYLSTSGDIDPCETGFIYGEFEDYTVSVIPLEACANANAGTLTTQDMSVCAGAVFTLEVEGNSEPANGLTGQWMSSVDGGTDWSAVEGATSASYTVSDGITEETQFKYVVSCDMDDSSDETEVVTISMSPAIECYCEPEGTNSSRYINNFSATGEGDQEIDNQGSGFSDGGYGDFTDMVVSADADSEINFEADIVGGNAGFRIWVDWNNDGIFDPEEEVAYQSSSYENSHAGSFDVPGDADGDYRMRIVSHWLSTSGDIAPCATGFSYGEFEDYTVSVTPVDCLSPSDLEVTDITANSATVSWESDADNYNYAVTTEDEEPADADDSTGDNSVDLDNLDDNTTYYVWVQADCGESQSNWKSISFTTACDATDIPFTQDFEGVDTPDIPNCASLETNSG